MFINKITYQNLTHKQYIEQNTDYWLNHYLLMTLFFTSTQTTAIVNNS